MSVRVREGYLGRALQRGSAVFGARGPKLVHALRVASIALVAALASGGCGRIGLEPLELDSGAPPTDAEVEGGRETDGASCLRDGDRDGTCDSLDNCAQQANTDQLDSDLDGVGDACDPDRDDDGLPNERDPCPGTNLNDSDADGVCDDVDQCPKEHDRNDRDRDGIADACDPCPMSALGDPDHDEVCEDRDVCPNGDDRIDSDGDAAPDACDECPLEPSKTKRDLCDCAVLPRPSLARYRFDETSGVSVADERRQHPGILMDSSGTSWVAGQTGNALSFDGSDDYVQVGALSPGVRSLAFWIKVASFNVLTGETAWLSPTANGSRDNDWSNPTAAHALDRSYAGSGDFSNRSRQDWYNFQLAVPLAASIPGIAAEVVFNNGNVTATFLIDLSWNGGLTYTAAKGIVPAPYNDERLSFGGPSDAWGHIWLPAQLSDASFRVRLTKDGIPLSPIIDGVDHIRVKAYYSSPTPIGRNVLALAPGVQVELLGSQLSLVGWPPGTVVYVDGGSTPVNLGSAYQHVVVASPSDLDVSGLQIGGVAHEPPFFHGALDDLRVFDETLSPAQVSAMFATPGCGQ